MPSHSLRRPVAALALAMLCLPAAAEQTDRNKPMTLESDQPCTVNLLKQTSSCSGRVVISQGTLVIRADRIEVRETPEGYQMAIAIGSEGRPASYRSGATASTSMSRAWPSASSTTAGPIPCVSKARPRCAGCAGAALADEIQGNLILWDNVAELFTVQGGAATPSNPGGRVRAVLSPRQAPASAAVDSAASAAAAAPALRPTPALGTGGERGGKRRHAQPARTPPAAKELWLAPGGQGGAPVGRRR